MERLSGEPTFNSFHLGRINTYEKAMRLGRVRCMMHALKERQTEVVYGVDVKPAKA
jgi:hypothetical protein